MDISDIKTVDRTVEIRHPKSGEPLGIRLKIMSLDDERLAPMKRKLLDRRLYLEARGKTFKADEIEENKINLMIAAITDWEWYKPEGATEAPSFHGEADPDFNRKNVAAILTELPWFAEQVGEAAGETESFFDN